MKQLVRQREDEIQLLPSTLKIVMMFCLFVFNVFVIDLVFVVVVSVWKVVAASAVRRVFALTSAANGLVIAVVVQVRSQVLTFDYSRDVTLRPWLSLDLVTSNGDTNFHVR